MIPAPPTNLVVVSAAQGLVVLRGTGAADVVSYDVYRSTNEAMVGDKINVSPIAQPADPYTVNFVDDGVTSVSPPVGPTVYFYRMVAVNADGQSIPSDAVPASVGFPQDLTPIQATLVRVEVRGNQ